MSAELTTTDERADPDTKAELMARVDQAWAELLQTIEATPEPALTTIRDEQGWSAKDHLVHVSAWEQSLLALIQGRNRTQAMGLDEPNPESADVDDVNDVIFQKNRHRGLDDVLAAFHRSHEELLAALAMLGDDDLLKPYSHYQPNDPPFNADPVIGWIKGNTYEHYEEHTAWIRSLGAGS